MTIEAHADDPSSSFVQLATGTQEPSNRTVAFRGFFNSPTGLMFATDCRSAKVHQLQRSPQGSLCWYFHRTREQFRLTGIVTVVDRHTRELALAQARVDVWGKLSTATKTQFFWPGPGEPRSVRFEIPTTSVKPSAAFCLLILTPSRVDHLLLKTSPHTRIIHELKADGSWSQRAVNP
jgi:PPOX class probable FMN-dependent enzyme